MAATSNVNDIFVRHNVHFTPKESISHLQIQNGLMLLGMQERWVQHIRLQKGSSKDIMLPLTPDDKIKHLHLDSRGMHAIVSTALGENFYINTKTAAFKSLRRLKNHVVTAIGWNSSYGSESETGFIVLGTDKGVLFETNIDSSGGQPYLKPLNGFSTAAEKSPICSLFLNPCSLDDDNCWAVIVCLPARLYCVVGTINLDALKPQIAQPVGTVWSSVMVETQQVVLQDFFTSKHLPRCHQLDSGSNSGPNKFCVYPLSSDEMPQKFCWLSADGVNAGRVLCGQEDGYEMIVEEWRLKHQMLEGRYNYPLDVALSEYHVCLLFADKFVAVSLLDQKVAFEAIFLDDIKPKGLARDATSQYIWVFGERTIFNYRPMDETRDVWRILLDRGEFAKARRITKAMIDTKPYQVVIRREAEKFLTEKKFVAAAELLAESAEPFENSVLKFLKNGGEADSSNGLKRYLELRLNAVDRTNKVQRDILVIWLLEVQLSELAELRRMSLPKDLQPAAGEQPSAVDAALTQKSAQMQKIRDELHCFLNRATVIESIGENRAACYRILASHGDFDTQIYLANKLKDYDVVIKVHLLQREFAEALAIAANLKSAPLFYKYAEDLFANCPVEFVKALVEFGGSLDSSQFITAFLKHSNEPKKVAAALVYLNHAVEKGGADAATHDFLIRLLADAKPTALLAHLKRLGRDRRQVPYDVSKALRICLEKKLTECCVFLYCVEEMYETAIRLALTISVELAKECALELNRVSAASALDFLIESGAHGLASAIGRTGVSDETKKHVWIEIAKHMIQQKYGVEECMALLRESNSVLRIQDILPFFPEFTKIEHFKEPLCAALKEHSRRIKELQKEMSSVTGAAEKLRQQIQDAKLNTLVVRTSDRCAHCAMHLLSAPFFAFNCRHFFHYDCLCAVVAEGFAPNEATVLDVLRQQEKSLRAEIAQHRSGREKEEAEAKLNVLKRKLADYVAAECPHCGPTHLAKLLAKPLISDADFKTAEAEWSFL